MDKKLITFEIDEAEYDLYKNIVESAGRTINQTFMMLIEKTLKETNINWLFSAVQGEVRAKNSKKEKSIAMFNKLGYKCSLRNTTFATKTSNCATYWMNPDKKHLTEDWYIILDDNINNNLHLLFVPKNSITNLKMRNDKICNVAIAYDDQQFNEIYTNTKFGKFFKQTIKYNSLV